ncbi:hypothetical protein WR25_16933 [Diploscapter pachys]|uniref:Uncharacterized protein n=1 Tax=Diploscapter pachys TaxID=2018661 RepID=A0A2A2M5W1_9BILA|nr:hypothetical protein WR25_16933 [Diploscapter pachys]
MRAGISSERSSRRKSVIGRRRRRGLIHAKTRRREGDWVRAEAQRAQRCYARRGASRHNRCRSTCAGRSCGRIAAGGSASSAPLRETPSRLRGLA